MHAKLGDYIIQGVNGELYPCKPDIFLKTYEKKSRKETILNISELSVKQQTSTQRNLSVIFVFSSADQT